MRSICRISQILEGYLPMKQRCTAITVAGIPCRAWAVAGSDPPRCAQHGGRRPVRAGVDPTPGAAPPLPSAARPTFYAQDPAAVTIDEAIAGLVDKMARLDEMIAGLRATEGADGAQQDGELLLRLLDLYTKASSRLARLLRDRRALSGEAADGISAALAQALDELSTEWGVAL
jgi:hypothetical protein